MYFSEYRKKNQLALIYTAQELGRHSMTQTLLLVIMVCVSSQRPLSCKLLRTDRSLCLKTVMTVWQSAYME